MRTYSHYDPFLIIGQLVNEQFLEIQDKILLVRRHTKEGWVLLTEFLSTLLYFD